MTTSHLLRYELPLLPDETWWEIGWDPPLATFFAQRFESHGDASPLEWHGWRFREYPDLDPLAAAMRSPIPAAVCAKLEAARAAHPPVENVLSRILKELTGKDPQQP